MWGDDSGEDHYELRVFDALGNLTWENDAVPSVSGGKNVSVDYAGPALKSGMIYQFRAVLGGRNTRVAELEQPVFAWK